MSQEILKELREIKQKVGKLIDAISEEQPFPKRFNVELACSSINEAHGQDAYELISFKLLKGVVVCDGVSNANGEIASRIVSRRVKEVFSGYIPAEGINTALELALKDSLRKIKDELRKRNKESSATTFILALTDGSSLYIHYSGDGYIHHFREDLNAYSSYLLSHAVGSALMGYVGYVNGRYVKVYNSLKVNVAHGSFLGVATDGDMLDRGAKGKLVVLYNLLRKVRKGELNLSGAVNEYLRSVKSELKDDATLAIIWLREQ